MFPEIEPFRTGHLAVSDGNELYYEMTGNPKGRPALYLHGGPGGGIMRRYPRHFDPQAWLVVSFEQRGCGRSRPLATAPGASLATNTTKELIADIEALRTFVGAEKWLVYGASWGTTLALAYAQAHPASVSAMILAAVTTTTRAEVDWITVGMGRVFPEAFDRLLAVAEPRPGERVVEAAYRRITDPDPTVRAAMARAWCDWEDTHVSLNPGHSPWDKFQDPIFALNLSTLVLHYWSKSAFLPDGALLAGMTRLRGVPGVLIHGRHDISGPAIIPHQLHKAWPGSEYFVLEGEGHGGPLMSDAVTAAAARLLPQGD